MITTQRLLLREMVPDDVEGMFALDSDPAVHQFLGNKPLTEIAQAAKVVEMVRKQYTNNGIGRYAMIRKNDGTFIGWCGLKLNTESCNGFVNYYDLGYRLRKEFWGNGYASEAASVWRNYAFEILKLDRLYAAAHVDNLASNKILRNLGFENKSSFLYDAELNNWYELPLPTYSKLIK